MVTTQVHVKPADYYGHSGVGTHGYEEERGVLNIAVIVDCKENSESGYANANREDGEEEAVFETVGEVSDCHGEAEGGGPWGYRVKLSLDGGVAVGLDDGG